MPSVASRKEETNGVYVLTPPMGSPAPILSGKGHYQRLTWDEKQMQLVFTSDKEDVASAQSKFKKLEPMPSAKFIEMKTLKDPNQFPEQRRTFLQVLEWPYVEGLRLDEAQNPLTLFATGLYGKPLPAQNGAPLRLVTPWKYGFKGVKAIVSINFTDKQPVNTWQLQARNEYGFYANVNPSVDHPRWSQASERRIGDFFKRPTLMFNGYTDQVASMYSGMDLRKNF